MYFFASDFISFVSFDSNVFRKNFWISSLLTLLNKEWGMREVRGLTLDRVIKIEVFGEIIFPRAQNAYSYTSNLAMDAISPPNFCTISGSKSPSNSQNLGGKLTSPTSRDY